jgi:hypothetical protein
MTQSRHAPADRLAARQELPGVRIRFNNGRAHRRWSRTLSATFGLMHRGSQHLYSITSSARASTVAGTSRPSALAVLRLMTNSNLVGCNTGRSAGFSPLRMRPA